MPLNLKATQVFAADHRPREILSHVVFSTGVDEYGDVIAGGAVDPHWSLVYSDTDGYPGPDAHALSTIWPIWPGHATPSAKWIHYKAEVPTNAGRWEFEQQFELPPEVDPNRTVLKGRVWMYTTDGLCELSLNGAVVAVGYGVQDVVIEGGFVTGTNTLRAVIRSLPWLGPSPSQFMFRADELSVAPATVAPVSIDLAVDNSVSGQQYRYSSSWTAPAVTNLIDRYEIETRRWADSAGTTPLDPDWLPWRTARASETAAYSSVEQKPIAAAEYLQARLRIIDRNDVRSAWVYSPVREIEQAAPGGIAPSQIDVGEPGQILVVDPTATTWELADLAAGANVTIVRTVESGTPTITIAAAAGGGGGGVLAVGTWADFLTLDPGDYGAGQVVKILGAPYEAIADGSGGWIYLLPGIGRVYPPSLSMFTWANQGGATAVATNGPIYIVVPASAVDNVRALEVAYPTPPFTVEALISTAFALVDYAWGLGPLIRDSGSSSAAKLLLFGVSQQAGRLWSEVWFTNQASYVATNPTNIPYNQMLDRFPWMWYRVADDGTNITFSISYDNKVSWSQIRQASRTSYLSAPTRLGIGANSRNNAVVYGSLASWQVM